MLLGGGWTKIIGIFHPDFWGFMIQIDEQTFLNRFSTTR